MRSKLLFLSTLMAMLMSFVPGFSQTVPSAYEGHLPFSVGAGVSNFDVDWSKSRMYGGTLWAEWYPGRLPRVLDGLGMDIEARDINYGRPDTLPSNFRQDTAGGGPMYTYRRFRRFRPYGKFLVEYGSFDFNVDSPTYKHDTRTLYASGGGVDLRAFGHVWVRADYEYQIWQSLLGGTPDPQGFTLGAVYDFRGFHHRE